MAFQTIQVAIFLHKNSTVSTRIKTIESYFLFFFLGTNKTQNLLNPLGTKRIIRVDRAEEIKLRNVYKRVVGLMARCSLAIANSESAAQTVFRLKQSNGSVSVQFNGTFEKSRQYITWTSPIPVEVNQIMIETRWNSVTCTSIQLEYIECKQSLLNNLIKYRTHVSVFILADQKNATATEHQSISLTCSSWPNTTITIESAFYRSQTNKSCTTSVLRRLCDICQNGLLTTCAFNIDSNVLLADPCPGKLKELDVTYSCLPQCKYLGSKAF